MSRAAPAGNEYQPILLPLPAPAGEMSKALAAGMNVIRYNQRNCGGTDALAPVLYHSGLSEDVAAVARDVIARDRMS